MDITWRPAGPDEFEVLFRLHGAAMRPMVERIWGWDEETQRALFRDQLTRGDHFLIDVDGAPAGHLQLLHRGDHIEIGSIAIAPPFQRRGVGSTVIARLGDLTRASGLPLRLQVRKVNDAARRLYERLGFVTDGETESHFRMVRV